ncbi:MipA/OmpV family protein [Acidovorax sp. JHL-9]|uniref:MipA/OmpV family protein n=1 Tax=Acidovorax sp. JHL-9 TaxID=1276756 RepID=UPI00040B3D53|nr:MipA/OmpV family protein [Acidovorax sp. JHL-9]
MTYLPRILRGLGGCTVLLWGLGAGLPALAEEAPPSVHADGSPKFNYVLGAIVGNSPDYAGSSERSTHLRPAWALEYGRFRLSTSRGSTLMGHGLEQRESGATAILTESDRFSLSASLRLDSGRKGSDSPLLAGLPEVRSTVRARLSAGYAITPRWSVGAGLSQDILGRSGGAQLNTSVSYTLPVTQQTRVVFGAGASFGDRTYMHSRFGVPAVAGGAGVARLPAYELGGGLYSVDLGVDVMTALNRHWVLWGGVGVSQVQSDARRSPLTVRPTGYSASLGLAYRCCR